MYVVRKAYEDKVAKYVRMHGEINLGPGGAFHDAVYVMKNYGIVPQEIYKGDKTGDENPVHNEMDEMIKAAADVVLKAKNNNRLTPVWPEVIKGILDAYLGEVPEKFTYNKQEYTPKSYQQSLGLNLDDYIPVTSFTHHPFYSQFMLEVPDNWMWQQCHNVPLEDMKQIINNALNKGYGVAWAADVSEPGFSWKNGVAIVPEESWDKMGKPLKDTIFNTPVAQKEITQELRQKAFDNYETQDDHGMHITGIVKDQNGTVYYKVKNSWGESNDCGGYIYASESYVLYKTTNILVHKDAIPDSIAKKMGLKK